MTLKLSITVESTEIDELLNALTDLLTGESGGANVSTPNPPDNLIPNPPDNLIPNPPDNTPVVELDAEGLPWDARIHGKAKKQTVKEKTWKKIKGVDKAVVAQVEAELRAALGNPGAGTDTQEINPATALYDAIMSDLSKWIGAGSFTPDDVTTVLLGLNVPDLAYLKTCNDMNVLSTVKTKLGEKWFLNTAT